MQPVDQAVGQFVVAQIEIDESDVGHALGGQALRLGRGRGGSGHVRPKELEQALHRHAEMPGILDQQDMDALQVQCVGFGPIVSVGRGH